MVWRTLTGKQRASGAVTVSVVPTTAALFSPLLMDLDGRSGNQGLKEKNVAPNSLTILELHYDGTTAIWGFGAKLEYDPSLVEVVLDEFETDMGEGSAVLPLTRSLSNGVVLMEWSSWTFLPLPMPLAIPMLTRFLTWMAAAA